MELQPIGIALCEVKLKRQVESFNNVQVMTAFLVRYVRCFFGEFLVFMLVHGIEMPGMYQTSPQSEKKRLANGTNEKLLNELSRKPLLYHSMLTLMKQKMWLNNPCFYCDKAYKVLVFRYLVELFKVELTSFSKLHVSYCTTPLVFFNSGVGR